MVATNVDRTSTIPANQKQRNPDVMVHDQKNSPALLK